MQERFSRTGLLFGEEAMERLWNSRVAVFGVGGVGGAVVEGLARSGIGNLELIDMDTVEMTNINRQLVAMESTLGRYKVDAAAEHIRDISPETKVTARRCFFLPETSGDFDFSSYDYVVDAIDNVSGKIEIVMCAQQAGVPVISAMGAGKLLDPTALSAADIYETSTCPLARVMRRELKKRGVKKLRVVYSQELPHTDYTTAEQTHAGRMVPASNAFVPTAMGFIIAGEVVKALANRTSANSDKK